LARRAEASGDALPDSLPVCYKPDMRKWMRERIKRRKKDPDTAAAEPAPAPLQPAFYDTEPPREERHAEESHSAPATPEVTEPEPAPPRSSSAVTASSSPAAGSAGAPRRRRKRGRGGRGRGGSGQRAPVAPAVPAAVADAPTEAQAPPTEAAGVDQTAGAAAPRPPRGTVVLAIGLPGSGKSSWFKRHNITPLSSDMLRAILFDDPSEQRFQDLVFSNLRSMLKARLIARRPMNYVDATNLTSHDRHAWIKLAKDYGYEAQAVFFDVPVEVCLERNQRRERVVSEDVMRRMAGKLRPPTFEEGFSKITVVRVKPKE